MKNASSLASMTVLPWGDRMILAEDGSDAGIDVRRQVLAQIADFTPDKWSAFHDFRSNA